MTKEEYEEYGRKLIMESPRFGKTQAITAQLLNWLSYSDNPTEFKPFVFEHVITQLGRGEYVKLFTERCSYTEEEKKSVVRKFRKE